MLLSFSGTFLLHLSLLFNMEQSSELLLIQFFQFICFFLDNFFLNLSTNLFKLII